MVKIRKKEHFCKFETTVIDLDHDGGIGIEIS